MAELRDGLLVERERYFVGRAELGRCTDVDRSQVPVAELGVGACARRRRRAAADLVVDETHEAGPPADTGGLHSRRAAGGG